MRFYFEGNSEYNGLQSFVYSGTTASVDNGTAVPENKCYCSDGFCPPSGVYDMTKCAEGAPIYISYPHFYNADTSYRQAVRGMSPDPEKHKYFVRIEPVSWLWSRLIELPLWRSVLPGDRRSAGGGGQDPGERLLIEEQRALVSTHNLINNVHPWLHSGRLIPTKAFYKLYTTYSILGNDITRKFVQL